MTPRRFPSPSNFTLRLARAEDFEILYAIDQACYSPEVAYTRDEMRWYLNLRGAECAVAELRRGTSGKSRPTIAGFVLSVSGRTHGHIITMDVLETHRRKGIGSALLHHTESVMKRGGIQEVWLETATNNESAIAFWKKHGYRNRGVLPNYYPNRLDAYTMSKSLNSVAPANKGEPHG